MVNSTVVAEKELAISDYTKNAVLSIQVNEGIAAFYYSAAKQKQVILLASNVDVSNLSTKKAGGFVGSVVGMYAGLFFLENKNAV